MSTTNSPNASKQHRRPPNLSLPSGDASRISLSLSSHDHSENGLLYESLKPIEPSSTRSAPGGSHPLQSSPAPESERNPPRTTSAQSASSSLDPYYYSQDVPSAPLPKHGDLSARDQAEITDDDFASSAPADSEFFRYDRRGLVGVGELATPRWDNKDSSTVPPPWDFDMIDGDGMQLAEGESEEIGDEIDLPDSPWTIEAIDGEADFDDVDIQSGDIPPDLTTPQAVEHNATSSRNVRTRPSLTLESGGEEVLYPRRRRRRSSPDALADRTGSSDINANVQNASAFLNKAEGELEYVAEKPDEKATGVDEKPKSLNIRDSDDIQNIPTVYDKTKDARLPRKPHSLITDRESYSKTRLRRKTESSETRLAKALVGVQDDGSHSRQASQSSSSSSHDTLNVTPGKQRRRQEVSRLPPSPATSSIRQLLRPPHAAADSPTTPGHMKNRSSVNSPGAAHTLLRGVQEGWSGLDDQATVEVLRKLDGVVGKGVRARSSVTANGSGKGGSRPGTPGMKPAPSSDQWEGVGGEGSNSSSRSRRASSASANASRSSSATQDEGFQSTSSTPARKSSLSTGSTRSSFAAKRSSASSTAPSSVASTDVAGKSHATMNPSQRLNSLGKVQNVPAEAMALTTDGIITTIPSRPLSDESAASPVPPVPRIPRDLSSPTASKMSGTPQKAIDSRPSETLPPKGPHVDSAATVVNEGEPEETNRAITQIDPPSSSMSAQLLAGGSKTPAKAKIDSNARQGAALTLKTPSKKWSFSSALNLRMGASNSATSGKEIKPREANSPLVVPNGLESISSPGLMPFEIDVFDAGDRKATSAVASSNFPTTPVVAKSKDVQDGEATMSSQGSTPIVATATPNNPSNNNVPSSKRLTPSGIPFFRRSSSQALRSSQAIDPPPSPGPISYAIQTKPSFSSDDVSTLPPTPSARKGSVLGLGLPGLLRGSGSRRSLQSERLKDAERESRSSENGTALHNIPTSTEDESSRRFGKGKQEKDRSESRISVLMRRRGKTVSYTDKQKPKSAEPLPPMQMPAISQTTASRVASIPADAGHSHSKAGTNATSRVSSATISSLAKQAELSSRSRTVLPSISGSPSTTVNSPAKDLEPPANVFQVSTYIKETPTKIPRKFGRNSSSSPQDSAKPRRLPSPNSRSSLHMTGFIGTESSISADLLSNPPDEFGVFEPSKHTAQPHSVDGNSTMTKNNTGAVSRSQATLNSNMATLASTSTSKVTRDSYHTLRKSSTGSTLSSIPSANSKEKLNTQSRFTALSPSKSLKFLAPKSSLPAARLTSTISQALSPSSSRQSLSTPSPVPASIDEDELIGDEEMLNWMKRQQSKKAANPAKREELEDLLRVPESFKPSSPLSPADILGGSEPAVLSEYERREITEYDSVYHFGATSKKNMATQDALSNNHGYDDERGDYLAVPGDHLAYRYEIVDTLGKGSFGQVLRCRDHRSGESVAIKIIRNKKRFHHQALVEIKILDNLRKWDPDERHYVIKMNEFFYFRNHLCIAMELLSINLYELIKANGFVGFTTNLIRRFTTQLLGSLSLMRHHRVVHCDLKPENVLLKHPAKSAIKVIDFGSSCLEHEKVYTYIQSRFYRSPEVILGMNYHMAIDMWSLGCILAELYTGFPIFPGENEQEQLSCIMEVLGIPEKDLVNRSSRKRLFFDSTGAPRPVVNSKGRRRRPGAKTLAQVLRCDDELFIDFVSKCLVWDPERRLKPQPAMRHPFMTALRRAKATVSTSNSLARIRPQAGSVSNNSRSKAPTETPRKSQIGAPTALSARITRVPSTSVPATPVTYAGSPSSRLTRVSQTTMNSDHTSRASSHLVSQSAVQS